ncbi:MAG TPA: sporulation protein YabP [Candidatus Limivivens intestinipullorum]|uniref:Sporulation protein YabP n=1 Tax=Candidatus Limivivens intestinipullorum TaxID=2840858 RepID=A0A9D1ERZ9_9FIRM|nr:sporulation protein YabP [Candidatus Limivivens intestinipullorum]
MEEKQTAGAHRVTVTGRRNGAITGVSDVLSFDVGEIVLETELGLLTIKGQELHVSRLTLEQGEVDIDGKIDSMVYSGNVGSKGKGESLLGRLFK